MNEKAIPLEAFFGGTVSEPNVTDCFNAPELLEGADVVIGIDVMTGNEFLVNGRELLERIAARDEAGVCAILRIAIDQETEAFGSRLYPYDSTQLIFATTHRGIIRRLLREIPDVSLWRDGDDAVDVRYDISHFDDVAAIVKPLRRRRFSAQREVQLSRARQVTIFA